MRVPMSYCHTYLSHPSREPTGSLSLSLSFLFRCSERFAFQILRGVVMMFTLPSLSISLSRSIPLSRASLTPIHLSTMSASLSLSLSLSLSFRRARPRRARPRAPKLEVHREPGRALGAVPGHREGVEKEAWGEGAEEEYQEEADAAPAPKRQKAESVAN